MKKIILLCKEKVRVAIGAAATGGLRACTGLAAALVLVLLMPVAVPALAASQSARDFTVDTSSAPLTGLWWNENESGWGMSLTQQGPIVFMAWYTYDAAGKPAWYVMSSCALAGSGCSGEIYKVSGGTPLGMPWNGAGKAVASVGTGRLAFSDNNSGTFNFTLNGVSGVKSIARQPIATGSTAPAVDYSALWWNANESGWGVALTQQYATIFATIYTYDASGNPVWYVASSCPVAGTACTGDLYQVTGGSAPTVAWNGANKAVNKVGTVSFAFSDSSSGTMTYTIDGASGSRAISRQQFYTAPLSAAEVEADVVRLLEQSTLGPTEALIQEVKGKGVAAWLDEQLALNVTKYTQLPWFDPPMDTSLCINDMTPPVTPEKYCQFNKYSASPVAVEFFRQSKTAPDQLRLRMAHVWHQIFVVSGNAFGQTYAHAEFQQRLRDNAFGTFENLLLKYALSPQLGHFQNWVKNIPEHDGIRPNENFARELMQLFTIGVNALNEDGTPKLGANGELVATYNQADIETLARVLTGFSYPTQPGKTADFWNNSWYFFGDMIPFDQYHDRGAKSLFNGSVLLPAGMGAMDEVRAAVRALVAHANTPPFIGKQLIQKMVTSSPSPAYVARVAAVFKDNGSGVRGDLAAVTRAILLDPEARGPRKSDSQYGRLREPALFWTSMIRALDVTTDGLRPWEIGWESGQQLFNSPTVFNYYPADYTLAGSTVPAPEFGIFTSAEFLNRANQLNDLLYNVDQPWNAQWWGPQSYLPKATGTASPALTAFLPDAGNADVLVERMNKLFLHGTMRDDMRQTIVTAVNKIAPTEALRRVKMAINLTVVSVDYQVQK